MSLNGPEELIRTAENEEAVTPLPQVRDPLLIAQLPLDVDMTKLEIVPEKVIVARVWVDQVPAVRMPPVNTPLTTALTVPLVGRDPADEVV
jgi:hypothetical protein